MTKLNAIATRRQQYGMSQAQLAACCGCGRTTVLNWERGICLEPKIKFCQVLAKLGLTAHDIAAKPSRLKAARERSLLSVRDIAAEVGLNPQTIYNWEAGQTKLLRPWMQLMITLNLLPQWVIENLEVAGR